jgi:Clp amino terminal domain, pathogenicity island component
MAPSPTLQQLISSVRADAPTHEVLDELVAAAELVADLNQTGDETLDFFVDQCRRRGHSWTEISAALGVSKQAAHKRFMPSAPASDRYTKRAQAALNAATEEAVRLGHNFVGTEHLLLGLFEPAGGIAGQILNESGIPRDGVERKINERIPTTWSDPSGHGPAPVRTPRATHCLDRALAEALTMGHNHIGTEHLLLALFDDPEGLAAKILADVDLEVTTVRARVVELLISTRRRG